MRYLFALFVIILFLTSCSVNRQLTDLNHINNEVIVDSKVKVLYNKEDLTEKSIFYFKDIATGRERKYEADSTGYLITKLPKGEWFLEGISCFFEVKEPFSYYTETPDKLINFHIPDNESVVYIGDIIINWVGPTKFYIGYGVSGVGVAAVKQAFDKARLGDGYGIEFYSKNNTIQFRNYFTNYYNSNMKIEYFDLQLPDPDNLEEHVFGDPAIYSRYHSFNLTDGIVVIGNLRMLDKKYIYVSQGKKLYIFDKDKLISITDHDNMDITEQVFKQDTFERINYNSYEILNY